MQMTHLSHPKPAQGLSTRCIDPLDESYTNADKTEILIIHHWYVNAADKTQWLFPDTYSESEYQMQIRQKFS